MKLCLLTTESSHVPRVEKITIMVKNFGDVTAVNIISVKIV